MGCGSPKGRAGATVLFGAATSTASGCCGSTRRTYRRRRCHTVVEVPDDDPSGLGWLADGRLLVVGMRRKTVYRVEVDRSLERYADLSGVGRGVLNDMIVAQDARHGLRRGYGHGPARSRRP